MMDEQETKSACAACSDEIGKAVTGILAKHDGRLVVATLLAEAAVIAAAFRREKIWDTGHIVGMFSEAQVCALTYEAKAKLLFTDGTDTGVKQ